MFSRLSNTFQSQLTMLLPLPTQKAAQISLYQFTSLSVHPRHPPLLEKIAESDHFCNPLNSPAALLCWSTLSCSSPCQNHLQGFVLIKAIPCSPLAKNHHSPVPAERPAGRYPSPSCFPYPEVLLTGFSSATTTSRPVLSITISILPENPIWKIPTLQKEGNALLSGTSLPHSCSL